MHPTAALTQKLVEKVLGNSLQRAFVPDSDLLCVNENINKNGFELIKYYLNNPHLVTTKLIEDTVKHQLAQYFLDIPKYHHNPSKSWEDYIKKLENILQEVKYRRAQNFEFNELMPSMQQLLELQQECWDLTEQWYGKGNGNISAFYKYFVAMSEAAYITCFEYLNVNKFISKDHFVSQINLDERHKAYQEHEAKFYHDFVKQGGRWARGRSEIDATSISNIFYYKSAQLLFCQLYAKKLVVAELGLENYGQFEYEKRVQLWHLLQTHFPDNSSIDKQNIFYKFVEYINAAPGEFFNYFAAELPEVARVSPQLLFDIIKIAGIQTGELVLLSRSVVDNWPPKRNLNLHWVRKYALDNTSQSGHQEWPRIWPNEIPYLPGHGLSLCGNGLIGGWKRFGTIDYEWNTPTDAFAEENNLARDIEKMFRELKYLSPNIKKRSILPGEQLLSVFQNAIAYSTIKITQHLHIMQGTINSYLLYCLTTNKLLKIPGLPISMELVQVGNDIDAFFIKVYFSDLKDETIIQFLMQLNQSYFDHFGFDSVDAYIHLFSCDNGEYIFIYEPHVRLIQLESNEFLNPETQQISPRRPQLVIPQGNNIQRFDNEMALGQEFLAKLFDATCKKGAYEFFNSFIKKYQSTH